MWGLAWLICSIDVFWKLGFCGTSEIKVLLMLNLVGVSGFYQFNSKLIGSNFALVLMLLSFSCSANKEVPHAQGL